MERGDPARHPVRFGEYEADFRAGELRKHGAKIKLQKLPFQVLEMLLERPREVISREELRQRIWPVDTFVDFDQGLSNAIKRLREALSDSAENPRFIETVPRRGYRFIEAANPQMTFTYVSLGMAYEAKGMFVEALTTHEKGLALGGSPALHIPMAAHAHAASGNHANAGELLTKLQQLSRQMYIPFWSFAIVHEGLGEIELALECLEKAIENREALLVGIKVWPHFDKLRDDSRFQKIERRIGLRR